MAAVKVLKSGLLRQIKMGSTSLVLVGSGLVAWQVYSFRSSAGRPAAARSKTSAVASGSLIDEGLQQEQHLGRRWVAIDDGPEYLNIKHCLGPEDPSKDSVKAKGELRSMLHRRPWKLLRAMNQQPSGGAQLHLKNLRDLAKLARGMSDGEMKQVAQASESWTLVALASRTAEADLRFFLPPPPAPPLVRDASIPALFRLVLTSLPTDGIHDCIKNATGTALESYVASADEDAVIDVDLDFEFGRDTHQMYAIPRRNYYTGRRNDESAFLEYCLQVCGFF